MEMRRHVLTLLIGGIAACAKAPIGARAEEPISTTPPSIVDAGACEGQRRMRIHFYDVGEALAALVDLPDGRHILVDAGASPHRQGCDYICASENEHLLRRLSIHLGDAPIDLLWVTDQAPEDLGGVPEVLEALTVGVYVDNGRDLGKPDVRRAHEATRSRAVAERVVDPQHREAPMTGSPELKVRAIVPAIWPAACDSDPGECAIPLRIDYCASSVLFTGDVEQEEESVLDPAGAVTLLQVARHGSETSTSPSFLAQARPSYAVISAGLPGQSSNRESCHPRAAIVERLTKELGGGSSGSLDAFAGARCDPATERDWVQVPTTDRLWATERDGDIVLSTTGDGKFVREKGN